MKAAKKKLDRLFSAYAILNDARCVTCGAINSTLQGGHLFHRTVHTTRWDFRNCYCQCASCNARHELNFLPLYRVAVQRHGAELINELERITAETYPQIDFEWVHYKMFEVIKVLPRFLRLSDNMKEKIRTGTFTNKELVAAIHGYSVGT